MSIKCSPSFRNTTRKAEVRWRWSRRCKPSFSCFPVTKLFGRWNENTKSTSWSWRRRLWFDVAKFERIYNTRRSGTASYHWCYEKGNKDDHSSRCAQWHHRRISCLSTSWGCYRITFILTGKLWTRIGLPIFFMDTQFSRLLQNQIMAICFLTSSFNFQACFFESRMNSDWYKKCQFAFARKRWTRKRRKCCWIQHWQCATCLECRFDRCRVPSRQSL